MNKKDTRVIEVATSDDIPKELPPEREPDSWDEEVERINERRKGNLRNALKKLDVRKGKGKRTATGKWGRGKTAFRGNRTRGR